MRVTGIGCSGATCFGQILHYSYVRRVVIGSTGSQVFRTNETLRSFSSSASSPEPTGQNTWITWPSLLHT